MLFKRGFHRSVRHPFRAGVSVGLVMLASVLLHAATVQADIQSVAKAARDSVVTVKTNTSIGSGFLMKLKDAKGVGRLFVVTNVHVIKDAKQVELHLLDGKKINVTGVAGYNLDADIAVLGIDGQGQSYTPFEIATVKPEVGQRIIAIGSPRGLEFSVTDGIVSQFRKMDDIDWIQHTAPISPGNSGGPLLNLKGEVIGINTFKRIDGQSLNFASQYTWITKVKVGKPLTLAKWLDQYKKDKGALQIPEDQEFIEAARAALGKETKAQQTEVIDKIRNSYIPQRVEQIRQLRQFVARTDSRTLKAKYGASIREEEAKIRELRARLVRIERGRDEYKPILAPDDMKVGQAGYLPEVRVVVNSNDNVLVQWTRYSQGERSLHRFVITDIPTQILVTNSAFKPDRPVYVAGTMNTSVGTVFYVRGFDPENGAAADGTNPAGTTARSTPAADRAVEEKEAASQLQLAKLYIATKKLHIAQKMLTKIKTKYPATEGAMAAIELLEKHWPTTDPKEDPDSKSKEKRGIRFRAYPSGRVT